MRIEEAIQQKKFRNERHKAHINILYTAAWLSQQSGQVLKPYNISWQQFNVLRILRGMNPEPATIKMLTERMIDKMSNASRLVEKLKQKGLVDRLSCSEDRRRVDISITGAGLELLEKASTALETELADLMAAIEETDAAELNRILDQLRV